MKRLILTVGIIFGCLPMLGNADGNNLCSDYSHYNGYFIDPYNTNIFMFTGSDGKNISGIYTHWYGPKHGQYTQVTGECNGNQLRFSGNNGIMSVEFNGTLQYSAMDHVLAIDYPQVKIDKKAENIPIMVYYN